MNAIRRTLLLTLLIAGPLFAAAAPGRGAESPLAIKGYDPVAYFTLARPTLGDPRFEYAWDGFTYRFASTHHLELFRAEPDRYAPQYGNLCTAALARGFRVVSDPLNWIIRDGRLHLFGKPLGPGLMAKDSAAMRAKSAHNFSRHAELPWEGSPPR